MLTTDEISSKPRFRLASIRSFLTSANVNRGLERYRRVSLTAATAFISKALTVVIGLVSVPLTVHYLGAERYGVWLTISSLLTWMALTDFAISGNAMVNVLSEANGKDDVRLAGEYSSSAFWALTLISGTIGLIFTIAFRYIPWRGIFRVSANTSDHELYLACAFTLAFFVLSLPLNMINSIYSAYQDGFVANAWAIASNVLALVSLVVVTQIRGGLPALVLATTGTRVAVSMANAIYIFCYRYKWLFPRPAYVRWERIQRLFKLGGKYMITQLSSLGIYQSQPFIITQTLGPALVPAFVIAYKIITLPMDLSYIATSPFIAAFGEARARSDWKWIRSAFLNSTFLCIAAGLPAALLLALSGKWLIALLGGAQVVPGWGVIIWLAVYTVIGVALMPTGQIVCGLEEVGMLAITLVSCAFVTILFGILFAHPWGLAGVAAAMAVAKLLTFLPLQGYQVKRILRFADLHICQVGPGLA